MLFWHHVVLGNYPLVVLVGCPGRGPTRCCSSEVTEATKENLCEIIRPEALSPGCDSVWALTSFHYSVLLKNQEGVGATHCHYGLCVSEWMQDCTRNDPALYRGCPKSPWLQEFANGKIKFWCSGVFFLPQSIMVFHYFSWLDLYRSHGISSLN